RWQMRANSERLRASPHVPMVAWSSARSLVLGMFERVRTAVTITLLISRALSVSVARPGIGIFFDGTLDAAALRFMGIVEFVQQLPETIGHALADDVIVDPLQDIAEPALIFAAEAPSSFSYMGIRLHYSRLCPHWPLLGGLPTRQSPYRLRPR